MKKRLVAICLFMQVQVIHAVNPTDLDLMNADWLWVGSVNLGAIFASAGTQQTIQLAPTIVKTYTADKPKNNMFQAEIFIGAQYEFSPVILGQVGLAAGFAANTKISGVIWDDADPEFDNYIYQYQVQHNYLVGKIKMLWDMEQILMPWVSLAAGASFNNAHAYQDTPVIFEAVVNPFFSSKTNVTYTYIVGLGLETALTQQWQLGLGYEFADWGQTQLGRAREQTMNNGLREKNLYTHGFIINISALF